MEKETLEQLLRVRVLAPAEMKELEAEMRLHAERSLREVVDRARAREVEVECVLATGNSEEIVPREVEQRKADLFVLGKFGRSRSMR